LRDGPIGPGRRRRDAHIVGYYARRRAAAGEGLGNPGGAKLRLRPKKGTSGKRSQGHYKGRSPVEPRPKEDGRGILLA
jgi:hypothetical protein